MENPHNGRATLNQQLNKLEIIIPTKKNWLIIAFVTFWLCGWAFGFVSAIAGIGFGFGPASAFLLVWLSAWTIGGIAVGSFAYYMVFGEEVIIFADGKMTYIRAGQFFLRDKTYDLKEAKNWRIVPSDGYYQDFFGFRRYDFAGLRSGGTIHFNYGMKTVKIAIAIDEPESEHILATLHEKGFIMEGK